MTSYFRYTLLLILSLTPSLAHAEGGESSTYIAVGTAKMKKSVIAMPNVHVIGQDPGYSKTFLQTVQNDILFMDQYKILPATAYIEPQTAGLTPDRFKFSDWASIGTDVLIKTQLSIERDRLTLEGYVYDVGQNKQYFAKRYLAEPSDIKVLAHSFANDIMTALTGLPGIFLSRIVTACDRTGKKEIYTMGFDGTDVRQVTRHRSLSFAPNWSPDGNRIVYSVYTRNKHNQRNIDLYETDLAKGTHRLLSNRKGINSGAAYSPDGRHLALTMSFADSNSEIYNLDPETQTVTRLTKSFGVSVDPSWSPDGKYLAFVSSRTGKSMIFRMNADGSNVQRLTYAGDYNAAPSWSVQNKIAFAGWVDKHFDIFIMNSDGTKIERLTKGEGGNEDPSFSPDGNFITFSSNRSGKKNIYVMSVDGTFVKRLTFGLGECVAPKWSGSLIHK